LADGVDIRVIQLMLGHASLEQTQRYLNVTDEELRRGLQLSWNRRAQPTSPDGVTTDGNRAGRNNSQPATTSVDSRITGPKTAHDCLQFVTTTEKSWLSQREVSQPPARLIADQPFEYEGLERIEVWCARQDSNLRPLAPEANALSS
jgi:hypothetical protein